ncbi:unnamed protein product [Bursaphelenchus xylophilus]|uniref:(pine wood nematode) hypothetical protein n=1 Tax=Bursaphelenchus xylophilus TaxID=6326 RepID=A0A7I8WI33_BURXY|nr:unnamed protein product [Bursaphelenchus xylophilus]CAG9109118.1 unnamed protein product [Bursaphelenchus xylophilus]
MQLKLKEECRKQFSVFVLLESMDNYNWRTTEEHTKLLLLSPEWIANVKTLKWMVIKFETEGVIGPWEFCLQYYEMFKLIMRTAFEAEKISTIKISICVCIFECSELWFFDHAVAIDVAHFLKGELTAKIWMKWINSIC